MRIISLYGCCDGNSVNQFPMNNALKKHIKTSLARVGISGRDARDGAQWLKVRGESIRRGRGLLKGKAIVWTRKERVELVTIEVPLPGRNEVTVEVEYSVVSPGTERARLLGQRHAQVPYPHRPGYTVSGRVIHVGAGVKDLKVGDLVACRGVSHQSLVTLNQSSAMRIPANVSLQHAAMIELGIICGWGVTRANLQSDSTVCVIGMGPIGALTQRIAAARHGGKYVVVARSKAREGFAKRGKVSDFYVSSENDKEIQNLQADCVIEASGDPASLITAAIAARNGARIILLGSARSDAMALPVDEMFSKELELVGAHVATVGSRFREEGERFLRLLDEGSLDVSDFLTEDVDPNDAGAFYRRFAQSKNIGAPVFVWNGLAPAERVSPSSLFSLPAIPVRGLDFTGRPAERRPSGFGGGVTDNTAEGSMGFGMIGCGEIAVANASGIDEAPNTSISATFDTNRILSEDLANQFGVAAERDLDQLLGRSDVDAVVISVPHHLHAPIAIKALLAGKHVVVEKPMANNLESAVEMAECAQGADRQISVCFPMRYENYVVEARKLVKSGALGPLSGVSLSFLVDKAPSYWTGGYTGRAVSSWRQSKEQAGGGVLIMNLSHHLDLVRFITGDEIESLSANAVYKEGRQIEDAISISGRFLSGGTFSLNAGSSVAGTTHEEIRFWGDDGHLELSPNRKIFPLRGVEDLEPGRWQTLGKLAPNNPRAEYFSRFATAVHRGEPCDLSIGDGLAVQKMIEAAYKSAQDQHSICLADMANGEF